MTLMRKAFGFWKGQIVWFLKVAILLSKGNCQAGAEMGFTIPVKDQAGRFVFSEFACQGGHSGEGSGCGFVHSLWWVEAQ